MLDYSTFPLLDVAADFHTKTGIPVWYEHPTLTLIRPVDIQIHTTNACRYVGAIPVKILMHLAICVDLGRRLNYTPEQLVDVALHDVHEYLTGDLTTRLKVFLNSHGNNVWRDMEDAFEAHVHGTFGITVPTGDRKAAVKRVDLLALHGEMVAFHHAAAPLVTSRVDMGIRGHGEDWAVPDDLARAVVVAAKVGALPPEEWWDILCGAVPDLRGPRPQSLGLFR
jgi:hypothetical protein